MSISESQLITWANQGATTSAQQTHLSIRNALSAYSWSKGVTYDDYLQGSYRNHTNIRGDSDVDLVVELTSTFYSNLNEEEKRILGLTSAAYQLSDFRQDVISALTNYYGARYIDTTGSKSIKILPNSGRLKADVVVCATYRLYSKLQVVAEGITFWNTRNQQQIINYPKLHYLNGSTKNDRNHTDGWYKPSVRMFKNARNRVIQDNPHLNGQFPSYFIECLLYNVPDSCYGKSYQDTYTKVVKWLYDSCIINSNADDFMCQNGVQKLFGNLTTQWDLENAKKLISQLIILWDK